MLTDIKEKVSTQPQFAHVLRVLAEHLSRQGLALVDIELGYQAWDVAAGRSVSVEAALWYQAGQERRLVIVEGWQRRQPINAMYVRAMDHKRILCHAHQAIIVARRVPTRAAISVARDLNVHLLIWKQARTPA